MATAATMETSAGRFDILANLPTELVLEIFDWLTEPEVIRLRGVCTAWKERIERLRKDRVYSLAMNGRKDYPMRLPTQIRFMLLPRSLRYLDISSWRLKHRHGWGQSIFQICPLLRTLVIRSMNEAPLNGAIMLVGSPIEELRLVGITAEHCVTWLPMLHGCRSLRELRLVFSCFGTSRQDWLSRSGPLQLSMELLETLEIEVPKSSRECGRWTRSRHEMTGVALILAKPRLCEALRAFCFSATRLQTLKIDVANHGSETAGVFSEFVRFLYYTQKEIGTAGFSGIFVKPSWLRFYKDVKIRRFLSDISYFVNYSRWSKLWLSGLKSLDIQAGLHEYIAFGYPAVLPLAPGLTSLKLADENGVFANCLMYTLTRGLLQPITSLKTLSIAVRPADRARYTDGFDIQIERAIFVRAAIFEHEDLRLLSVWFPNLETIKLINIPGVSATDLTARMILEQTLPHLRCLTIQGENVLRNRNGERKRERPTFPERGSSWDLDED